MHLIFFFILNKTLPVMKSLQQLIVERCFWKVSSNIYFPWLNVELSKSTSNCIQGYLICQQMHVGGMQTWISLLHICGFVGRELFLHSLCVCVCRCTTVWVPLFMVSRFFGVVAYLLTMTLKFVLNRLIHLYANGQILKLFKFQWFVCEAMKHYTIHTIIQ